MRKTCLKFMAMLGACATLTISGFAASGNVRKSPELSELGRGGSIGQARKLPFSFEDIASYFTNALETQPEQLHGTCVVFTQTQPGIKGFHETSIVVVTSVDENLSVTLLTNADYGMNYLREFIESRFFFPEESERFYYLLHDAPGPQWVEMFRFRVQLNVMETANWEIVGMTFSPHSLLDLRLETLD